MIKLEETRNDLIDILGHIRLRDSYMLPNETSPQQRFAFIAQAFSNGDDGLAARLYEYISKHWLSPSSPQLSFGRTKQGLPIACFLPYLPDTTRGLIDTWAEVSELSVIGGGIGLGVGIRPAGDKSSGVIHHLRTYDASSTAYKQGQTRRGSYAAYLDISHPEIISFLNSRRASGDYNYKLMNLHNAVNIPDSFMKKIWFISTLSDVLNKKRVLRDVIDEFLESGRWTDHELNGLTEATTQQWIEQMNRWDLVDPHTKEVKETVSATYLWEQILIIRAETGEPYLHFIDTSNAKLPAFQKELGLSIKQSNLCVSGDTLLLTKEQGNVKIKDVAHQAVHVWNGDEWSMVTVQKTGLDQEMVRVSFSNGSFIVCTPYHKCLVLEEGSTIKQLEKVPAYSLTAGFPVVYFFQNFVSTVVYVTSITTVKQKEDTFCFTEFKNSAAVFNGLLLGQCSEIVLPTDERRTAVCCLASLNLDYFDLWKDNKEFYLDVATYLDNVLQYFIDNAPIKIIGETFPPNLQSASGPVDERSSNRGTQVVQSTLKRAVYSAHSERAIGIGALGFHSYLQSKNVPLESMTAYHLNNAIFKKISTELEMVNLKLGRLRGSPPDCVGTGRRFSHMMAIAPNATSSIIMGNTSPSCEPFRANIYKQDTLSGSHVKINKHLEKLLETKIGDPLKLKEIYRSVKMNDGSVQHLTCLTEHEKSVFKTWPEISQEFLIRLAAARQKYIDQSQSVSLFFKPNADKSQVHKIHLQAWLSGLKTLYYYRSTKLLTVDKLKEEAENTCIGCEG